MTQHKNKKRRNSMVRLNPKQKSVSPKGEYVDIDEATFIIENNLPLNYKNGRKRFNKSNNGKGVK